MVEPLPTILTLQHLRPDGPAFLLFWQSANTADATVGLCCIGIIVFVIIVAVVSHNSSKQAARAAEEAARLEAERHDQTVRRHREAAQREAKALAEARTAYEDSLTILKANPTSVDLRQRTLDLGRVYANLARNKQGASLFTEIGLLNDINAATAGTVAPPETEQGKLAAGGGGGRPSIEERLATLAELKVQGLISEEEYSAKRRKIIDEI